MLLLLRRRNTAPAFAPTDIAGLKLWLKADSLSLNDADPVITWTDSSGQGNDVTQGTAAKRPTYQTNEINGKPVVRFDGTDDYLAAAAAFLNGTAMTVFVVQKTSGDCALLSGGTNDQIRIGQGSDILSMFDSDSVSNPMSDALTNPRTSFIIAEYQDTGAGVAFWENGTAKGTTGSVGTMTTRNVGIANDLSSLPVNGDIAEILAYDSAIAAADRDAVETYLGTKYNITVA